MTKKETKTEELEQHDFYDDDYIDSEEKILAPLIGSLLINFSRLEQVINTSLSDMISLATHQVGYVIIKDLDAMEKVRILRRLVVSHLSAIESKNLELFQEIYKRIVNCVEFRNTIAHANWNTLDKDGFVRVKMTSGKNDGSVIFQKEKLTPQVIEEMTKEMFDTEDLLEEFLNGEGLA